MARVMVNGVSFGSFSDEKVAIGLANFFDGVYAMKKEKKVIQVIVPTKRKLLVRWSNKRGK